MTSTVETLARRLALHTPGEIELPPNEQAAVAVILAPAPDGRALDLLLIQRALRDGDPWSGHMALPGGRRESEDRDLGATAVRETLEETGVDLRGARLLGRLDDLRPIRQSARSLSVRPFVFATALRPALTLSGEVAEALWVPFAKLATTVDEVSVEHRGAQLRVSAFVVDGRVVWGMTQRVLASLLALSAD